jgi:hypothetical protein
MVDRECEKSALFKAHADGKVDVKYSSFKGLERLINR